MTSTPDAGDPPSTVPDAGSTSEVDAGATPQCIETEDNILGPFYREGAPFRDVLGTEADGQLLHLEGTVRLAGSACAALEGALLDVWQADDDGVYDNTSFAFAFRGRVNTDPDGNWALQTILPGRYLNGGTYRPRHIHFRISHPNAVLLTTQLYFEGDPFIEEDPFVRPALIIPLQEKQDGWHGRWDIVLAPA